MLAVYEKMQIHHPRDVDRGLYICTGTEYRVIEAVGSPERTSRSSTARRIDSELASTEQTINCWANFWQRTIGLRLLPIRNAVTSPSPYLLDFT